MPARKSGRRTRRMHLAQRAVAIVLLVSMALSGVALYAASSGGSSGNQPTQQGR